MAGLIIRARELDLEEHVASLAAASAIEPALAGELERAAKALRPALQGPLAVRFLHNDIHAMNVMYARDGPLLALLDWGDTGWGDPALELAQVPLGAAPFVLQGYESEAHLDNTSEARILWDKLCAAVEQFEKGGAYDKSLDHLLTYISGIA